MEDLKLRSSGMQMLLMCGSEVVYCMSVTEYLRIDVQGSKLEPRKRKGVREIKEKLRGKDKS